MALFRSRAAGSTGENRRNPVGSEESVETMRRRARHRLIGATVLVAAGVVGFPMLFDTQPRPVASDVPIEIPERDNAAKAPDAPLLAARPASAPVLPAESASQAVASRAPASTASRPEAQAANTVDKKPEPPSGAKGGERIADSKPDAPAKEREPSKSAAVLAAERSAAKAAASRDELRIAKAEEAARARALLQGSSEKEAAAAAAAVAAQGRRYIVQIGAFSEPERARSARMKAERAGIKTYTQEAKTGAGTWIRVRVGPFATRAEADEAAAKIKGLSLPASILTI